MKKYIRCIALLLTLLICTFSILHASAEENTLPFDFNNDGFFGISDTFEALSLSSRYTLDPSVYNVCPEADLYNRGDLTAFNAYVLSNCLLKHETELPVYNQIISEKACDVTINQITYTDTKRLKIEVICNEAFDIASGDFLFTFDSDVTILNSSLFLYVAISNIDPNKKDLIPASFFKYDEFSEKSDILMKFNVEAFADTDQQKIPQLLECKARTLTDVNGEDYANNTNFKIVKTETRENPAPLSFLEKIIAFFQKIFEFFQNKFGTIIK